jgi:putative transposase
MQWLLATYAQRYRKERGRCGHLWQGRFRSCPVQSDRQMVTLLRYVERNPVRAGLVTSAEAWPWSSVRHRVTPFPASDLLAPCPVELPQPWLGIVNEPLTSSELARVRDSVGRGRPLGDVTWERDIALRMGLSSTLGPRGRPPGVKGSDPFRMRS